MKKKDVLILHVTKLEQGGDYYYEITNNKNKKEVHFPWGSKVTQGEEKNFKTEVAKILSEVFMSLKHLFGTGPMDLIHYQIKYNKEVMSVGTLTKNQTAMKDRTVETTIEISENEIRLFREAIAGY